MSKRVSKYLSLILRHQPDKVGLTLDKAGWVDLDALVEATPPWVTREGVLDAVANNDKQRFSIVDGRIRANQGHSIDVDLGLSPVEPPEFLYHGTHWKAVATIQVEGLQKMNRHHVHMSTDSGTAIAVGRRAGAPVLFKVLAGQMHRDGHTFYCSTNGVWLVEHVPAEYLELIKR